MKYFLHLFGSKWLTTAVKLSRYFQGQSKRTLQMKTQKELLAWNVLVYIIQLMKIFQSQFSCFFQDRLYYNDSERLDLLLNEIQGHNLVLLSQGQGHMKLYKGLVLLLLLAATVRTRYPRAFLLGSSSSRHGSWESSIPHRLHWEILKPNATKSRWWRSVLTVRWSFRWGSEGGS